MTEIIVNGLFGLREATLHCLPCNLMHDGRASVSTYFEPLVHIDSSIPPAHGPILRSSFRGRCLRGKTIDVPKGYQGVVVKEARTVHSDEQNRSWAGKNKFSKFSYWNLETPPSENDCLIQALDWVKVAALVHSSVPSVIIDVVGKSPRKIPTSGSPFKRQKTDVNSTPSPSKTLLKNQSPLRVSPRKSPRII